MVDEQIIPTDFFYFFLREKIGYRLEKKKWRHWVSFVNFAT